MERTASPPEVSEYSHVIRLYLYQYGTTVVGRGYDSAFSANEPLGPRLLAISGQVEDGVLRGSFQGVVTRDELILSPNALWRNPLRLSRISPQPPERAPELSGTYTLNRVHDHLEPRFCIWFVDPDVEGIPLRSELTFDAATRVVRRVDDIISLSKCLPPDPDTVRFETTRPYEVDRDMVFMPATPGPSAYTDTAWAAGDSLVLWRRDTWSPAIAYHRFLYYRTPRTGAGAWMRSAP